MGGLKKYRSFEDARIFDYSQGFNYQRAMKLFREVDGVVKNPYKPGIYRFSSFKSARKFDIDLLSRQAAEKKKGTARPR